MKIGIPINLAAMSALVFILLAGCAGFGNQYNEFEEAGGGWWLYKNKCSGCHGLNGEGQPPVGTALKGTDFMKDSTVDDIKDVIRAGRIGDSRESPQFLFEDAGYQNMPAFDKRMIKDTELNILAKWIKDGMKQR